MHRTRVLLDGNAITGFCRTTVVRISRPTSLARSKRTWARKQAKKQAKKRNGMQRQANRCRRTNPLAGNDRPQQMLLSERYLRGIHPTGVTMSGVPIAEIQPSEVRRQGY